MERIQWSSKATFRRNITGQMSLLATMIVIMMMVLTAVGIDRNVALAQKGSGTKTAQSDAATPASLPNGKQIIGYYPSWAIYSDETATSSHGRDYQLKDFDDAGLASRTTTLFYAFSKPMTDTAGTATTSDDYIKCSMGDYWADYMVPFTATNSIDNQDEPNQNNNAALDPRVTGKPNGNFHQLQLLKAKYPNMKVVMSIGGWTWSDMFSQMAKTAIGRQKFVQSCVDMFITGNITTGLTVSNLFDGLDVDWEYPGSAGLTNNFDPINDPANFIALLAEFRSQLNTLGAANNRYYSLHIASPAGYNNISKMPLAQMHQYLDSIGLMSYDMHGAYEDTTNFQAPLYDPASQLNVDYAVQQYLNAGVPASKLIMGIPFYGRGWKQVPANSSNGLYVTSPNYPTDTLGMQPADGWFEQGIDDYHRLKKLTTQGFTLYRDNTTKAAWLWNPTTRIFWGIEDPTSIGVKMNYVKEKGLGGALYWDATGDDRQGSLITAMYDGLMSNGTPNGACAPFNMQGNTTNVNGNCSSIFSTNGGSLNGGWQFTQTMTNAVGLRSYSKTGTALYGISTSGVALYGYSVNGNGVYGYSVNQYGLTGGSVSNTAVRAASTSGIGLYVTSSSNYGSRILTTSGLAALRLTNSAAATPGKYALVTDGSVYVDGDIICTDCTQAMSVATKSGDKLVYADSSTQNMISDQGTATLKGGRVVIKIDATFAQTVNLNKSYMVVVTPNSADTAGLAVINKNGTSFEVVELNKGKGNFSFDYRITASRAGYENVRLKDAPAKSAAPSGPTGSEDIKP